MSIIDVVLDLHDALATARLTHAFGGALALSYVAEPRATIDVDVNVFSPIDDVDAVLPVFANLGLQPEHDRSTWIPAAGIRLRAEASPVPVDLFPSLDPDCYAEIARRRVRRPFGPDARLLPFLSAEDLVVFKLSFGRAKDWVDLRSVAATTPRLDLDYVERQVLALRGPHMHPRVARMRRLLRDQASP